MLRNKEKIQTFNDGMVHIFSVSNAAENGKRPVKQLQKKHELCYDERTVGVTRLYAAKQANAQIAYLLRCPRLREVSTQDRAIPNDGRQYQITAIQYPEDVVPPCMDITLERVTEDYDITKVDGSP